MEQLTTISSKTDWLNDPSSKQWLHKVTQHAHHGSNPRLHVGKSFAGAHKFFSGCSHLGIPSACMRPPQELHVSKCQFRLSMIDSNIEWPAQAKYIHNDIIPPKPLASATIAARSAGEALSARAVTRAWRMTAAALPKLMPSACRHSRTSFPVRALHDRTMISAAKQVIQKLADLGAHLPSTL
jgi:hypothetical protein